MLSLRLTSSFLLLFALGCGSSDSGGSASGATGGISSASGGTAGSGGGSAGGDGGVAGTTGGSGNTGTGGLSEAGAGSDGGTSAPVACPAVLPTFGTSCPVVGLTCTYGDNPRPSCRTIMTCGGAEQCNCGSDNCLPSMCTIPKVWVGGGPGSGVGLTDRCSWTCPATPPKVGDPCTPPGYCAESDGTQCGCIGVSQTGSVWTCLPPPSDPRCPRVAPLVGSPCTDDGLACANYDICVTGSRVVCKTGSWVDDFGNCPK